MAYAAHRVARRTTAKHKSARRHKSKPLMSRLGKAAGFLALPIPDVELAIAAMANPDSGIKFVLGIAKRAGKRISEVQSVLFDKVKWTAATAKQWLKDHDFTGEGKDEGATFWRFRQKSPSKYKEFRTIVPGAQRNPTSSGRFGRKYYQSLPGGGDVERYATGSRMAEFHPLHKKWSAQSQYGYVLSWHDSEAEAIAAAKAYYAQRPHLLEAEENPRSYSGRRRGSSEVRGGGEWAVSPGYQVRFIRPDQAAELMDLFHLARTALSGQDASNYNRMLWASKEFSKAHPEVSSTAAYKDLDGLRSNWFGASNPASLKQLYVAQHRAEEDGESYTGKYPASSTTMERGFRKMLKDLRAELLDERGKLTPKDRESYRQVYYQAFRQADYRSHKGMMAASSLRTPGAGASSNPDYPGQWTSHEDAKPPFYVQVKDKGRWRPMYGGEGIYPDAREASRAMVAHAGEYSGKFAWRALDGDGRIFDELKARPGANPTPGEAIWYQITPGSPTEIFTKLLDAETAASERSKGYPYAVYVYRHGSGVSSSEAPVAAFLCWFQKNPTPGEAIKSYDEHLETTTDPEFQAATPDEQAVAMTVQDGNEAHIENPVPSVADGPGLHVVLKNDEFYAYANGKYLWRHHDPERLTDILKREWGWDWDGQVDREAWEPQQNPRPIVVVHIGTGVKVGDFDTREDAQAFIDGLGVTPSYKDQFYRIKTA